MRFNNDDYLRAFSREDRDPAALASQLKTETPVGDVFDQGKESEEKQEPETEPEDQGGAENGDE